MSKVLPLIGSILWVLVVVLRTVGASGEAEGLENLLRTLNLPTTMSPAEILMAAPVAWGIFLWARKQYRRWRGVPEPLHPPVLQTEADMEAFIRRYQALMAKGMPWEEARERALRGVLITHPFPAPVPAQPDARKEG